MRPKPCAGRPGLFRIYTAACGGGPRFFGVVLGLGLRFVCLKMYVTCSMGVRGRLWGRMAVASAWVARGCVRLPDVERADETALQAAFNRVVEKRYDDVQIPYFAFLKFLLGLSELGEEGRNEFLDTGDCEIEIPVLSEDKRMTKAEVLYFVVRGDDNDKTFYTFETKDSGVPSTMRVVYSSFEVDELEPILDTAAKVSEAVGTYGTSHRAAGADDDLPWLRIIRGGVASHCASLGYQDDPWRTEAPAAAAGGGASTTRTSIKKVTMVPTSLVLVLRMLTPLCTTTTRCLQWTIRRTGNPLSPSRVPQLQVHKSTSKPNSRTRVALPETPQSDSQVVQVQVRLIPRLSLKWSNCTR